MSHGSRSIAALLVLAATPAAAAPAIDAPAAAQLATVVGVVFVAVTFALLLLRSRQKLFRTEAEAATTVSDLRGRLDRIEALVVADAQVIVTWGAGRSDPEVMGDPGRLVGAPAATKLLAFGTWLEPDSARAIDARVDALRQRGEPFRLVLKTALGGHVEAEGGPFGAAVMLRLRDVTGERLARAEIEARSAEVATELGRVAALLEALTQPVWLRDEDGRLTYANEAYARAVETRDGGEAVNRSQEFLDQAVRAAAHRSNQAGQVFRKRAPAVFAGQRRIFDVVEAPAAGGSGAIAIDVSELEDVRADQSRQMEAHRRTLDKLATAVAIFKADGSLAFHNQAYRQLWGLDAAFLEEGPSDGAILDRLDGERKLPDQKDFRGWKRKLHECYREADAREELWHLPDSRVLRMVAAPNPEGGVTYLFDDMTERYALESEFNALSKVQSETIDHLQEAVVVFGSDGRLKLNNPAFAALWRLDDRALADRPHADQLFAACSASHIEPGLWARLATAITTMPDARKSVAGRLERRDGKTVDVVTRPLPDGGTLVTFTDVTALVNVEKALRERAEAVEAASKLKAEFTSHVSFELRDPLNYILGFCQVLGDPRLGELAPKQREYVEHISSSGADLLAIVNNILDLTTIDAGAMELELGPVAPREAIEAAAEGVRDRLAKAGLGLEIDAPDSLGTFQADPKRVRQVLFNLLSNAIGFSKPGLPIRVTATRENRAVVFRVEDQGTGIPPERIDKAFERFESKTGDANHRGVGLGLSIVRSFVELHGGTVSLESTPGAGTVVTCRFPDDRTNAEAAE